MSEKETSTVKELTVSPEVKRLKAVIYTDGGCRAVQPGQPASRGIGAWGMHGYLFVEEPSKVGSGCKNATPTNVGYRMGSSEKPTITIQSYVDGFGGLHEEATNQTAELHAAIHAIKESIAQGVTELLMLLDSQYVLKGIEEWSPGWIARNWLNRDGQPVANKELWKELLEYKRVFETGGGTLTCQWVKGHNGNLGNELADRHATRGIIAHRNGEVIERVVYTDAKGYWNHKPAKHRFFTHSNWYFAPQGNTTGLSEDGRYVYYSGTPRERDEFLGKPVSDSTFSVIYLKEPDPVLTVVQEAMRSMGKGIYQGLMVGHLDALLQPAMYEDIQRNGVVFLVRDFAKQRLKTPKTDIDDEKILVHEERPARMAFHAVESLESLEGILKDYLNPPAQTRMRVTDITDLLYERDSTKKKDQVKLRSKVNSAMRSLKVEAIYSLDGQKDQKTKLTLTLDLDLPSRNALSAIAHDDICVNVVTWPESPHAIRYAIIVETQGDSGIWSGIYSNLHLLDPKPVSSKGVKTVSDA